MRAAVVGTGGLGGYFAALLARAGHDVVCIARGPHLEAIRAHGLTLKSPVTGEFTVSVHAADHADGVGPVDLVLCCVKTYDLEGAAEHMRPLIGADTVVVPVQNGIDAAERLTRVVPGTGIVGGVCYVAAGIETPGVIRHAGGTRLVIGELDGGNRDRIERVIDLLRGAGVAAELAPNIRVALWEKFVGVCATGGVMALTRLPMGPTLGCPETRAFFRHTMEEVVALAQGIGVALPGDYGDRMFSIFAGYPAWTESSMLRDVRGGRRLELEALNGTVVRLGRERGVPTPANTAIYAALKPYLDGAPTLPRPE
jgi:2-dehydropantoate 2-reductase